MTIATSLRIVTGFTVLFFVGGPADARPMKFEEQLVEAEVQKPEIQVYVTRQNLNKAYDLELKESFIPRIIEALEQPPF